MCLIWPNLLSNEPMLDRYRLDPGIKVQLLAAAQHTYGTCSSVGRALNAVSRHLSGNGPLRDRYRILIERSLVQVQPGAQLRTT